MFEKFKFSGRQIDNYYKAAARDLAIAGGSDVPEVKFKFSYDALLKLCIAVCAKNNLRIKSRQGHHVELIKQASVLLKVDDINIIGQKMRAKRNKDLYGGGVLISAKEANEIYIWLEKIFADADAYLFGRRKMI